MALALRLCTYSSSLAGGIFNIHGDKSPFTFRQAPLRQSAENDRPRHDTDWGTGSSQTGTAQGTDPKKYRDCPLLLHAGDRAAGVVFRF